MDGDLHPLPHKRESSLEPFTMIHCRLVFTVCSSKAAVENIRSKRTPCLLLQVPCHTQIGSLLTLRIESSCHNSWHGAKMTLYPLHNRRAPNRRDSASGTTLMPSDVTQLLTDLRNGRREATDVLVPLVLDELRAQAAKLLQTERPGHTLQTTALVHEAYVKLVAQQGATWNDRVHFFAVAARAMRHILVDHARKRKSAKRGGTNDRVESDFALLEMHESSSGIDVEALHNAMAELANIRPRAAQIVDMRFFGAMAVEEIAAVLDSSVSTVEREWRYARAWLKRALGSSADGLEP